MDNTLDTAELDRLFGPEQSDPGNAVAVTPYSGADLDRLFGASEQADAPQAQSRLRGSNIDQFVSTYTPVAQRVGEQLGVDPSTLLGQWGLETGWGKSIIKGTHNLGNIKDFSHSGPVATDNMTGQKDAYRAYDTPDDFGNDFASLIARRYGNAVNTGTDSSNYFRALKAGGYAQDPAYVAKGVQATAAARNAMQAVDSTPTEDWTTVPVQTAPTPTSQGDFWRGVSNYIPQMKEMGNSIETLAGAGVKKLGFDELGDSMISDGLQGLSKAKAQSVGKDSDSFTQAWQQGIGTVITDWLPYQAGQTVGNIGEGLAAMGVGAALGAAAGTAAAPGAGTAVGVVAGAADSLVGGILFKSLLKKGVLDIANKMAQEKGEQVARNYLQREAMTLAGTDAAMAAQAIYHGFGETGGRVLDEAQKNNIPLDQIDLGRYAASAAGHATLEFIGDKVMLGGILGEHAYRAAGTGVVPFAKTLAGNIGKTGIKEMPVEVGQTALERTAAGLDVTSPQAGNEYLDAAAAAGVMGISGAPGGVRSYLAGDRQTKPAASPSPLATKLQEQKDKGGTLSAAALAGNPDLQGELQQQEAEHAQLAAQAQAQADVLDANAPTEPPGGPPGGTSTPTPTPAASAGMDQLAQKLSPTQATTPVDIAQAAINPVTTQESTDGPAEETAPIKTQQTAAQEQTQPANPVTERFASRLALDPAGAAAQYAAIDDTALGLNSEGGRVLNVDLARELSPDYRANRSLSADVHEPASAFIKQLYADKLSAPTPAGKVPVVLFTAGGTGAGKSTSLQSPSMTSLAKQAEIVYDTNMSSLDSSVAKINQALEAGRDVFVQYTWRDPVEALVNGSLPRAERTGRTVPMQEHAKTHIGSRAVVPQLVALYQNNPRVKFGFWDNSRGKGDGRKINLTDLPHIDTLSLKDKLNAALEQNRSTTSDRTYQGSRWHAAENDGPGAPGLVQQSQSGAGRQSEPQHPGTGQAPALSAPISGTIAPNPGAPDLSGHPINTRWTAFHPDSGTLNIPRKEMPQIKSEHRGAMVNFLKARGIESTTEEVTPDTLKPTQREFSPGKVEQAKNFVGNDRALLVSSDGYVLDGHHQWLAKRENNEPVKVTRLDAPIKDLLTVMRDFPSAGMTKNAEPLERTQVAAPVVAAAPVSPTNPGNPQVRARRAALAQMVGNGFTQIESDTQGHRLVNPATNQEHVLGSSFETLLAKQAGALYAGQQTSGTQNDGRGNQAAADTAQKLASDSAGPSNPVVSGDVERGSTGEAVLRNANDSELGNAGDSARLAQANLSAVQGLARRINNPRLVVADPKSTATQQLDHLLTAFSRLTGHRGIAIDEENGGDGVKYGSNFFVNVRNPQMHVAWSVAHEFKHLSETYPGIGVLYSRLWSMIDNEQGKRNYFRYLQTTQQISKASAYDTMSEQERRLLKDEMVADFIGKRFNDEKWLRQLAAQKPKLFGDFVRDWISILSRLIDSLRGDQARMDRGVKNVDLYISQLEQAKQIAMEVATVWAEKNPKMAAASRGVQHSARLNELGNFNVDAMSIDEDLDMVEFLKAQAELEDKRTKAITPPIDNVSPAALQKAGIQPENAYPKLRWVKRAHQDGLLTTSVPDLYHRGQIGQITLEKEDGDFWGASMKGTWVGPAQFEAQGYVDLDAAKKFVHRFVAGKRLQAQGFDLADTKTPEQQATLVNTWKAWTEVPQAHRFQDVGDDAKTLKALAAEMGLARDFSVRFESQQMDPQNTLVAFDFTPVKGGSTQRAELEITKEDGKPVAIAHTENLTRGKVGAAFYQLAAEYAALKHIAIKADFALSGVNTYRRTEQMFNAALRTGVSNVMTPHPVQRVYGFNDQASTPEQHDANISRLALASLRNALELAPELKGLIYTPQTGLFTNAQGLVADPLVENILARTEARAFGLGRSTLARAALTQQLLAGKQEAVTSFHEPVLYSVREEDLNPNSAKELAELHSRSEVLKRLLACI